MISREGRSQVASSIQMVKLKPFQLPFTQLYTCGPCTKFKPGSSGKSASHLRWLERRPRWSLITSLHHCFSEPMAPKNRLIGWFSIMLILKMENRNIPWHSVRTEAKMSHNYKKKQKLQQRSARAEPFSMEKNSTFVCDKTIVLVISWSQQLDFWCDFYSPFA